MVKTRGAGGVVNFSQRVRIRLTDEGAARLRAEPMMFNNKETMAPWRAGDVLPIELHFLTGSGGLFSSLDAGRDFEMWGEIEQLYRAQEVLCG